MRVTYDPSAEAAYIYLREIEPGGLRESVDVDFPDEAAAGTVVLDFDQDRRLVGIEVQNASQCLPKDLLDAAEPSGQRRVTFTDAD